MEDFLILQIEFILGFANPKKQTVTTVTTVTLAQIFLCAFKKTDFSGIFRILHYPYLQMSKICRNFVVSKDKADGMLIKEKFCYH